MIKKSRVIECTYSNEWKAPNGDMIYYHNLKLDNGDTGAVGTAEKMSPKIASGVEISYTILNGKIKLEAQATPSAPVVGSERSKSAPKSYHKKPEDYLGYSYSYAKDLVVAGKTKAADIKALKEIAAEIYKHVQELLNQNNE